MSTTRHPIPRLPISRHTINVRRPRAPGRASGRAPGRARGAAQRQLRILTDAGMATAEYAIVTVAACGFAGLLVALLRSDEVRGLLLGIIRRALAG
jgi:hypothetical protein